jgi:hypothetical protein
VTQVARFRLSQALPSCYARSLASDLGKSTGKAEELKKSEVRSRKSEVGSRKSEVGSQKSELGSQKLAHRNLACAQALLCLRNKNMFQAKVGKN